MTARRWVGLCAIVSLPLLLSGCPTDGAPSDAGNDAPAQQVDATGETGDASGLPDADAGPPPTVHVLMDYTHTGGFFSAPFPSEDRRLAAGTIDLHDYPNPAHLVLVNQLLGLAAGNDGFATTAEVAFALSGSIDATQLPDVHASTDAASPVFLIGADAASPDYLHRYPVHVDYLEDGGPYGAPHFLTLLPEQGIPLRPGRLYAAVVLRALHDTVGRPLDGSSSVTQLLAGRTPAGMSVTASAAYQTALTALAAAHVDPMQLAALTVFRTGNPTAQLTQLVADVLAQPHPTIAAPFALTDTFPTYCVYQTTIQMPEYQTGVPPYAMVGGSWAFDANGHAILQRQELANVVVSVPRQAMPSSGFPTTVLIRTGAGGDRPLVDRGVQGVTGGPPLVAGSGPAQDFANVGFAGASFDGPLGGLRNTTNGNEDSLMFNVANPPALRDNIRQSAMEIALFAHLLDDFSVDASTCPGVVAPGPVRFDTSRLALFGHSMGSTVAPLVLAAEPRYRAAILSGAGGSWIENVMYKLSPVVIRPVAEILLHYQGSGRSLTENDAALSLFQWACESADPPVYTRSVLQEPPSGAGPRNIFMVQGIVDTYILPPIANSTSLSLGLDLAGTPLDGTSPRLAQFATLESVLDLSGRAQVSYPVTANITSARGAHATAVVVQAAQDAVEDGHEVIFQTPGPKHQYQCYLRSFAQGGAVSVVAPGGEFDACP